MRCDWCGVQTNTDSRTCRGCKGVMGQLGRPIDDAHALPERGTWHSRPGGIKVWFSWDDDAA